MTIIGIENQKIEILITSYQFPETTKYIEDRNWLNVFLKVDSKLGEWKTVDPALTTYDLISIKDWFNQIKINSKPNENQLEFIEPNLSFEFLEKNEITNKIRIKFDLEFRPINHKKEIDYFVDCELTQKQIDKIIEEMNLMISNYSIRE